MMMMTVMMIRVLQGSAVFHSHTGISEQRTYVDGVCHGPASLTTPQGDSEERMYEAGKLHGTATFFRYKVVVSDITMTTFISVTLETRRRGVMCLADWMVPPSITTQGDNPESSIGDLL